MAHGREQRRRRGCSTCWWRSSSSRPSRTAPTSPTASTGWPRASPVPIVAVLGVLAYLSGHIVYADYLDVSVHPRQRRAGRLRGGAARARWSASCGTTPSRRRSSWGTPASLSIGGIIAVSRPCIRKELLLPLLCGVFLVESFSVMMQVGYFESPNANTAKGSACC